MDCSNCKSIRSLCCWECVPSLGESKGDRYAHLFLMVAMTACFFVFLQPAMEPFAQTLPCCTLNETAIQEECQVSAVTVVTLRLSCVFIKFYSFVFLLDMFLKSTTDRPRRGFWFAKVLLLLLLCYGSLLIKPRAFDQCWTIFLALGATVFVILQLYTMIRLSYVGLISLQRMVDRGSKPAHQLQIALLVSGIFLSVISESLLILYYPFCGLNVVCLVTNAVIPSLACLWSISDCVKARNGYSGFLQGSILCCFVQFWTWSAFSSNPDPECNPYPHNHMALTPFHVLGVAWAFVIYVVNTNFTYEVYVDDADESIPIQKESSRNPLPEPGTKEENAEGSQNRKLVSNNVVCALIRGPMLSFVVMTLFDWAPQSSNPEEKREKLAFWFKLVACWLSTVFFIITLYLPGLYGIRRKKDFLDIN
ncbi:UNVERIFIED_CONTAM: hypothetical protein PYX00_008049 [Menopon gallinae]|uniref:Uncharacterized protein n=1 Tax=Menopon gallinae TaxID=328185 RepID=A0AAW2HM59_9NEOP